jgi:hypothetical protein
LDTVYGSNTMTIDEIALLVYICIHYIVYTVLQYQKAAAYDAE